MKIYFSNLKWLFIRRPLLFPNVGSILLIMASFAAILLTIPVTDEPVFLHYTIYFGIDLIGPWIHLFLMPASGLLIFFINLLLSTILYKEHLLLVFFLVYASALAQILILTSLALVILQNIS